MKNIIRQEKVNVAIREEIYAKLAEILKNSVTDQELKEKIDDFHENDIAEVLELLSKDERSRIYKALDEEKLSEILSYADDAEPFIDEMDNVKASHIIETMDADDAVDVLEKMDDDKRKSLISLMNEDAKEDISLIKSFDDDEVGSLITTNFIKVNKNSTIKQAMKALVSQAAENDNISTIYAVDENDTYYGAVDLKDLILAREKDNFDDIIVTSYPFIYGDEKTDQCINAIKDYYEDSLPVLDRERHIIGVITLDDVVELIDDEMGEDYAKLAGLTAEEDLNETLFESMKKRVPWLIVLLGLGLVVSSVVGIFEGVVSQLAIVVCFQSLILDMAGNVGTQSLAVTIRVLTDENLNKKELLGLIIKETKVGFSNGMLLGALAFVSIGLYIWLFKSKGISFAYAVSGCIGFSLMVAMMISSFTGTIIPIFFKSIKIDPAVASGPLITTVNDLVAVISYYGLVWLLLINVMNLA